MATDVTRDTPLTAEEHGDTEAYVRGMSPTAKMNPNLRQEDQKMELAPTIVGPPAYASPNPATNEGRLVSVEEHPLSADIADDYGAARKAAGPTDSPQTTASLGEAGSSAKSKSSKSKASGDNSEPTTKADWQAKAKEYGLPTSGNLKTLKKRVKDVEEELEADKKMLAGEWTDEIEKADDADALASIRERYGMSGSDFSTVQDALDKKQAEIDGTDNGDGDTGDTTKS